MYRIAKRFEFSAAHQLGQLGAGHPCARLHGHNYGVELELAAPQVGEDGLVVDYRVLDRFGEWLDANVDHRYLNAVAPVTPTAELLAKWLFLVAVEQLGEVLPEGVQLAAVRVSETGKTWAEYRRG